MVSKVTVLTADVVSSRNQEERTLSSFLAGRVAALEHSSLIAKFSLSRGDELQAVARGALVAPELIRRLRYVCRPLRLRIGVGIGPTPERMAPSPWDMTGEAFFRARDALDMLKRKRRLNSMVMSGSQPYDEVANGILDLLEAIQSRWTDEQWQAVDAYEREGTYEAAGKKLGIAFQNVAKRCRTARWASFRRGELALSQLGQVVWRDEPALTLPGVKEIHSPYKR